MEPRVVATADTNSKAHHQESVVVPKISLSRSTLGVTVIKGRLFLTATRFPFTPRRHHRLTLSSFDKDAAMVNTMTNRHGVARSMPPVVVLPSRCTASQVKIILPQDVQVNLKAHILPW